MHIYTLYIYIYTSGWDSIYIYNEWIHNDNNYILYMSGWDSI